MQSSDPGHFFETDAEQLTRKRRAAKAGNKYGNPIQLKSKILAAVVDPRAPSSAIFVAESAGSVRRIDLDTSSTTPTYRGPTAPVCSVAVCPLTLTLYAGSWDKSIYSWSLTSPSQPSRKYTAHSDFVKALVCTTLSGRPVLISGGADKKIIVWDTTTHARLHTLQDKDHSSAGIMLSLQDLAIDHHASSSPDEIILVSASSDPHIRRWRITLDAWEQLSEPDPATPGSERRTILEHETTVYKLVLGSHDDDGDDGGEVDLYTSSGDGTAKCLSRLKGFAADDTFHHGGHVRAVAVTDQWVVTAGRDEDVKFWDRATGKLHCVLEGHFDEVTELLVLGNARSRGGSEQRVCSVGIDGTVRTWPVVRGELDALAGEQERKRGVGMRMRRKRRRKRRRRVGC
ncbi:WD40-repeat-containing domain protein [Bombardia bombarda]|uniref:WD40-repeat-containing domain protein n=1 Tax=Bombardia bombarda TaxID=252184 RepID=A0AA40BW42_9PEZI|nr:WD40-repeat-containing domain protein [Bombardia bombarda]